MDFISINDPITGFIFIPKKYLHVIDTFEVQRLRRIKQLSGAPYVYPGASHTRFEHSIGTMATVQKLIDTLKNGKGVEIEDEYVDSAILAGLCHDVGHGPFSHNFEEILIKKTGKDHEDFSNWIIAESEIGDSINDLGLDKKKVANLAVGRLSNDKYPFLDQMIAGCVDCDSMDYLVRDSYHCGTNVNGIDSQRLIVLADVTPELDLGFNIKGAATLESFLLARLNAFRTIYFHKTCRAVQIMIREAIKKFAEQEEIFKFDTPADYLKWDDISLYYKLSQHEASKPIIDRLNHRDLIKCCFENPSIKISTKQPRNLEKRLSEFATDLAKKTKLHEDQIFIDIPSMKSVPYQHTTSLKQNEIPVFSVNQDGQKKTEKLEDHTLFFNQIKGYFNMIRVYADKKYKIKVHDASEKLFSSIDLSE
jgi:HD superfamily phosphohydrolase